MRRPTSTTLLTVAWTGTVWFIRRVIFRCGPNATPTPSSAARRVRHQPSRRAGWHVPLTGAACARAATTAAWARWSTAVASEKVAAPVVAESPVNIECRVRQVLLGTHDMFLAEVAGVQADEAYIDLDGAFLGLERADPIVYSHGEYLRWDEALGICQVGPQKKTEVQLQRR